MSAPRRLSEAELSTWLAEHPAWTLRDGKLHRAFRFADFVEAFAFMGRVAVIAERQRHHPEWANVYDRVTIDLTTHEAGGITARDCALAEAIDAG